MISSFDFLSKAFLFEFSEGAVYTFFKKFQKDDPNLSVDTVRIYLNKFEKVRNSARMRNYTEAINFPIKGRDLLDPTKYTWRQFSSVLDNLIDRNDEVKQKEQEEILSPEQKETEKPVLVYNDHNLQIYRAFGEQPCITLGHDTFGKSYSFCVSRRSGSIYSSYRNRKAATFYFARDLDRAFNDKTHLLVIQALNDGTYLVTPANNPGEKEYNDWKDVAALMPKLQNLQSLFKVVPYTRAEEYTRRLKQAYNELGASSKVQYIINTNKVINIAQFLGLSDELQDIYVSTRAPLSAFHRDDKSIPSPLDIKTIISKLSRQIQDKIFRRISQVYPTVVEPNTKKEMKLRIGPESEDEVFIDLNSRTFIQYIRQLIRIPVAFAPTLKWNKWQVYVSASHGYIYYKHLISHQRLLEEEMDNQSRYKNIKLLSTLARAQAAGSRLSDIDSTNILRKISNIKEIRKMFNTVGARVSLEFTRLLFSVISESRLTDLCNILFDSDKSNTVLNFYNYIEANLSIRGGNILREYINNIPVEKLILPHANFRDIFSVERFRDLIDYHIAHIYENEDINSISFITNTIQLHDRVDTKYIFDKLESNFNPNNGKNIKTDRYLCVTARSKNRFYLAYIFDLVTYTYAILNCMPVDVSAIYNEPAFILVVKNEQGVESYNLYTKEGYIPVQSIEAYPEDIKAQLVLSNLLMKPHREIYNMLLQSISTKTVYSSSIIWKGIIENLPTYNYNAAKHLNTKFKKRILSENTCLLYLGKIGLHGVKRISDTAYNALINAAKGERVKIQAVRAIPHLSDSPDVKNTFSYSIYGRIYSKNGKAIMFLLIIKQLPGQSARYKLVTKKHNYTITQLKDPNIVLEQKTSIITDAILNYSKWL